MTLNKWSQLFKHYKNFHNFKVKQNLFKSEEVEEESEEWLKD